MLLVGAGAGYYFSQHGKEVLLEARAAPGPDPFTAPLGPVDNNPPVAANSPSQPGSGTTPGGGGPSAQPARSGGQAASPAAGGSTPARGSTPAAPPAQPGTAPRPPVGAVALSGGPAASSACDKGQLEAGLSDTSKASAFAQVLEVASPRLSEYIGSLRPGYLRGDTRVTNHGYKGGKVQPRQSVLQAGTAVLLDPAGVPVVRCVSGSPLLPPQPVGGSPNYTGAPWAGFDPSRPLVAMPTPQSVVQASSGGTGSTPPAARAGTNLVVDGGFESGLVAPWGTGSYEPRPQGIFWGQAQATATVVSGIAHSGTHALVISNFSAVGPHIYRTMAQLVSATPGASYCLSFWAQPSTAQPGVAAFPLDHAWTRKIVVPGGSSPWAEYAGTMTAEGPSMDLRILSENKGQVAIDDIVLTPGACRVQDGPVPAGATVR